MSDGFLDTEGLGNAPCRIMLKVRRPRKMAETLRKEGYRSFVLVERMYMDEMRVYRENELPEESDYMSILYARR